MKSLHLSIVRAFRSSLAICAVIAALSSCEEALEAPSTREFVIREGQHYASPRLFERLETRRLSFRATFDESAMYTIEDPAMRSDKNKLMGFSDCNCTFLQNSASFAWQWNQSQLEIYAYSYVDSVRIEQFISYVDLNEENLYEIATTDDEYVFYLNGERTTAIPRTTNCNKGTNHIVYPYFGGPVPAPHNVRIKIEIMK